jgi:Putative amidoligase enzyme
MATRRAIRTRSATSPRDCHTIPCEVDPAAYRALLYALKTGNFADFEAIPMEGRQRLLNPMGVSPSTIEGPDSPATMVAPPPALASDEIAAQMAEMFRSQITTLISLSRRQSATWGCSLATRGRRRSRRPIYTSRASARALPSDTNAAQKLQERIFKEAQERGFALHKPGEDLSQDMEIIRRAIKRAPELAKVAFRLGAGRRPRPGERTFGAELETFGLKEDIPHFYRRTLARAIRSVIGGKIKNFVDPADETISYTVEGKDGRKFLLEDDWTLGTDRRGEIISPILGRGDIGLVLRVATAVKAASAKVSRKCGIHGHIGAEDATIEQINRFIDLMIEAEAVLIPEFFPLHSDRKEYARFMNKAFIKAFREKHPKNFRELAKLWYGKNYDPKRMKDRNDKSRRRGLNLHSFFFRRTLELRYFNGTLSRTKLAQYIVFCFVVADLAGIPDAAVKPHARL